MSTTLDQIGIRLRKLRQDRRKSQHVLAATLHAFNVPITRDMLANWETCRSDLTRLAQEQKAAGPSQEEMQL